MKFPLYSIVAGVVLAGIIHISIILLIPVFASQDAWSKLTSTGPEWQFTRLNNAGKTGKNLLSSTDPLFEIAACRFSLNKSPLLVRAFGRIPFWSVAVFDRFGKNVYSFNDRTAIDRQLNLLIVSPVQMSVLRQDPPASIEQSIIVETRISQGFILIRALQPDPSWVPAVDSFLGGAVCEKFSP
jgi:uncharacterized membrane protein